MASTGVADVPRAERRHPVLELLARDGLLVAAFGIYVTALSIRMATFISQDTWYALVGGREVLNHGLPGTDTLTYWTAGRQWVDQQWLAQAMSYALFSVGGLKVLSLVQTAVATASVVLAARGARQRGAGPRATASMIVLVAALVFAVSSQIRAQTFAYPLFVAVLMLLLADVRRPSRRVFLVVPVLALWENLHGSVLLGIALVWLRGIMLLAARRSSIETRAKGALLVVSSGLTLLATPYGFQILGYYHHTALNPGFQEFITEWRAPALSIGTFPLFVLGGAAVWLLGRYHSRLVWFERLAMLLLLVAAFWSVRNVVWLSFGAIPILAPVADDLFARFRPAPPRTNVMLGLGAAIVAWFAVLGVATKSASWFEAAFPERAAAVVADAAARDPSLRIYSNERFSDWLLLEKPILRGRIAYDIRFELLTDDQLKSIVRWRGEARDDWRAAAKGARLIVLDPGTEKTTEKVLLAQHAVRLYRDGHISVLLRPRAQASA